MGRHGGFGRGKRAVTMYHLRDWALTNRALVNRDFEAFVIEKAERAETGAARGDSTALYSIVREMEVRKRAGLKKVILEDGPKHDTGATVVVRPLTVDSTRPPEGLRPAQPASHLVTTKLRMWCLSYSQLKSLLQ